MCIQSIHTKHTIKSIILKSFNSVKKQSIKINVVHATRAIPLSAISPLRADHRAGILPGSSPKTMGLWNPSAGQVADPVRAACHAPCFSTFRSKEPGEPRKGLSRFLPQKIASALLQPFLAVPSHLTPPLRFAEPP